jgi:hypothetical protein
MADETNRVIYWHRDLPPASAELIEEHSLEATSKRVSGSLKHRDELWHECYRDLLVTAEGRMRQELHRLGGDYAHVLDEWIDSSHDDATGEAWLTGRFKYTLYRRTAVPG